ncbi:MAG: glycine dehydrogenase (aminomethyl-transferring), partial [Synechococcus sp.]|nr:glycine dehydrogenase (aminomethyl-transferring) [Synechococcus sp.]
MAGFVERHVGPGPRDQQRMLAELELSSLEELTAAVVPADILLPPEAAREGLPEPCGEAEALEELAAIAAANEVRRSLIGLGYHGTATPAVIQRHVLENPCWYTAYTPYQAEIAQGRLEALLNFQTLVSELTGLPIANASLLDEGTAAAEAMALAHGARRNAGAHRFLVDTAVLPQTLAVLQTRAEPLGIELVPFAAAGWSDPLPGDAFGLLLQLPGVEGRLWDPSALLAQARAAGLISTVAIDPLAQVLLAPVGHLGADIAVGSLQRYGVPMGGGGPHAAFFATLETFKRQIPGRLVGRSLDAEGRPALRLALQTREQHIRRDKATSNICTAQVLLAVMAGFYAVHHGPEGLSAIARRILTLRSALAAALTSLGLPPLSGPGFDTLLLRSPDAATLLARAEAAGFNLRHGIDGRADGLHLAISLDEQSTPAELERLLSALAADDAAAQRAAAALAAGLTAADAGRLAEALPARRAPWLQQAVFQRYRSETELLRYIQRLASRDLSLVHGMIPLGSCTMKLNAAAELLPVSWPAFAQQHPFAPDRQHAGTRRLVEDLQRWLAAITGFAGVSLQPNAGSQGEYAGLMVIRAWHRSRGEGHRRICLIPT